MRQPSLAVPSAGTPGSGQLQRDTLRRAPSEVIVEIKYVPERRVSAADNRLFCLEAGDRVRSRPEDGIDLGIRHPTIRLHGEIVGDLAFAVRAPSSSEADIARPWRIWPLHLFFLPWDLKP
jgi:hypothetical protein